MCPHITDNNLHSTHVCSVRTLNYNTYTEVTDTQKQTSLKSSIHMTWIKLLLYICLTQKT